MCTGALISVHPIFVEMKCQFFYKIILPFQIHPCRHRKLGTPSHQADLQKLPPVRCHLLNPLTQDRKYSRIEYRSIYQFSYLLFYSI